MSTTQTRGVDTVRNISIISQWKWQGLMPILGTHIVDIPTVGLERKKLLIPSGKTRPCLIFIFPWCPYFSCWKSYRYRRMIKDIFSSDFEVLIETMSISVPWYLGPCYQFKAQPPFEVRLADWPWTPFGVCANLLRDRCSCRSYNFKV